MTCIVGIVDKESVYIGGDSAGVSGLDIHIRKDPKVFKKGDFIFGCTSSFRMIQIIRFSFIPPLLQDGKDIFEYMCTDFIDELRKSFSTGGFKETNNGIESGGIFLVGYKKKLFRIDKDFQVEETNDEFNCCGCGEDLSKGALFAMSKKMAPEKRIKKEIERAHV